MPYAETNGIRIYYETGGRGDPLVLIGGLGSTLDSWSAQVPLYSERFRVITFDNRGSGRSDKPDYPYTIEQMADDVAGLLDFLEIPRAHFAGKSMGGMVAQWLGIKYPERVLKLVMGCTSASRDEVGNLILRTGREITEKLGAGQGWLFALFLGYGRKYIEENYESVIRTPGKIPHDPESVAGYVNQTHACENHDVLGELHRISAKTLVMYGERDFITPPERAAKLAELIPEAVEKKFPDGAHGFWKEHRAEADRTVMEFLAES